MACGVPPVASDVGGLGESVQDGVTGLLVPARRPDRIADAVTRLLTDTARRRRMGSAGVLRARRYGWDRIASETLELGRTLADAARAPDRAASGGAVTASNLPVSSGATRTATSR